MDAWTCRLLKRLLQFAALSAFCLATSVIAQEPGSQGNGSQENEPRVFLTEDEVDIPIREAFSIGLPRGYIVNVFGGKDLTVSGRILYDDVDSLMLQLESRYDLLIVREGTIFQVFCNDAKLPQITYVYKCRESRAADLMNLLRTGSPLGLPKANELSGKGTGSFTQHAIPGIAPSYDSVPAQPLPPQAAQFARRDPPPVLFDLSLDNGIMVSGPLIDVREAVKKLKALDRPTRVIRIEVLIVQYFHNDQFTWRYNLADGAVLKADPPKFSSGLTQPTPIPGPDTFGPQPWGIDFQNIAFDSLTGAASLAYSGIGTLTTQFKQNLTLLSAEDLARVVTNPHIAVINGQSGQILLNEKFNFITAVVTPQGTVAQQAASLDSLTSINVTPTILGPNRVHIAVNTSLATFDSVSNVTSELPGQRINELGTSIILTENESLILGGLVKEEVIESRDKIPGIARLPLLGKLFRGKNDIRRFSETVVYITPRIYDPEGDESRYRNQVFEESDDLNQTTEEIRDRYRYDRNDATRRYHYKEQLDLEEERCLKEELKQSRRAIHRSRCRIHRGGQCDCYSSSELAPQTESQPEDEYSEPAEEFDGEEVGDGNEGGGDEDGNENELNFDDDESSGQSLIRPAVTPSSRWDIGASNSIPSWVERSEFRQTLYATPFVSLTGKPLPRFKRKTRSLPPLTNGELKREPKREPKRIPYPDPAARPLNR